MAIVVSACWALLALVHLTPALALVRPSLLTELYGVGPDSPLFLLMQHRAALFAAILLICLWCMVDAGPRRLATIAVGFSMLSFLWLWWQAGQPIALRRIALVDLAGLVPLAVVAWAAFRQA